MILPQPSVFNPQLKSEYLEKVSGWLLEELYATEDDLSRSTDTGYTRGCTTFGRQKSRIIAEYLSHQHSWLNLRNTNNDLVFEIAGIPCRFCNDDPLSPTKNAVLIANKYQMDFLEFAAIGEPGRFCFIIDRGLSGTLEPRVEFLGFTPSGNVACRWVSSSISVFNLEGQNALPETVEIPKPPIAPKKRDDYNDATSQSR